MISWKDIESVNKDIKTTDVKGKEYAEVNQRIIAFRKLFPEGTIATEIVSLENGVVVMKAMVYDGETLLGVGTAYEKEDSSFINKTSYIENCETSAVGRALGMCGFGIDTSVASALEVGNAILNQGTPKATEKQIETVKKLVPDVEKMLKYYKLARIEDLTIEQASEIIKKKGAKK